MKQNTQRLKVLRDVNAAILSGKSPEEIGEIVLEQIREIVPIRQASITRLDLARRNAVLLASHSVG